MTFADLPIIKGIHPGFMIERELKKRKLAKGRFAISVNEFPQTIGAITKGKRNMNTALSMRIEKAFDWEEGILMTLQVFHDIREEKRRAARNNKPNLSLIRPVIFWDSDINKIEWQEKRKAVIERVFKWGNQEEKDEITRFYGKDVVDQFLKPHLS